MKISFLLALICFLLSQIGATYPGRINSFTIQALSRLAGIFPFSVFEFLIYATALFYVFLLIHALVALFVPGPKKWQLLGADLKRGLFVAFSLYSAFILLWGLNYNNPPLHQRLGLKREAHSAYELATLGHHLVQLTNEARKGVLENAEGNFALKEDYQNIFNRSLPGFLQAGEEFPFLGGENYGRVKPILASRLLTYTFITGIYSPFTGEPNVNTFTPPAQMIFTTMHEIAHQRGVAREDEANFIAFLTSIRHPDPIFSMPAI